MVDNMQPDALSGGRGKLYYYTDRIVIEGRRKGSHLPDPDIYFHDYIKDVSKYIKLHRFLQNIDVLI